MDLTPETFARLSLEQRHAIMSALMFAHDNHVQFAEKYGTYGLGNVNATLRQVGAWRATD